MLHRLELPLPKLKTSFPKWSPRRIIADAVSAWNLRHPDKPCDGLASSWDFVSNVVHSWAWHGWTEYDSVVCPETRDALRDRIKTEVMRAYPWLRSDPRKLVARGDQTAEEDDLAFDDVARQLSEFATKRSDAMLMLEKLRRKRPLDRKAVAELEAEVGRPITASRARVTLRRRLRRVLVFRWPSRSQ